MQNASPVDTCEGQLSSERSPFVVALAGNPNSGKTTLFNALTGLRYKVANYPGVTVERKEGKLSLPSGQGVTIFDLPGTYTICGTSIDEQIATQFIVGDLENESLPDAIVVVIDATNIERNLYLATQLIDTSIPVIVALSMSDLAEKNGISIKKEILSRLLNVPVVSIIAPKKHGLDQLLSCIATLLRSGRIISTPKERPPLPWLPEQSPFFETATDLGAKELGYGATPERAFLVGAALLSEARTSHNREVRALVAQARQDLHSHGIDTHSFEATHRYQWINSIVKQSCSFQSSSPGSISDWFDWITTHRVFGVVTFLALMGFVFQSIFMWASYPMEWIDGVVGEFGNIVAAILPEGALRSLFVDGIISGVGSVIIFIPQIAILFFFIGLLEDSGYLARAAFVTDRIMRKVGLQGRSFIPLLSSFACAIPGILSTRTIPTFADRLTTILIAPLMSCSARIPVYTLLIAAFIPATVVGGVFSMQGLTLFGLYLLGILGALVVAWCLKLTLLRGQPAFFVMEMPPYRMPSLRLVLRSVWDRVLSFVKNAGTIILACSIILWFLASYPKGEGRESYARQFGHIIEPVIQPLGYNWEIGVGLLASFAAREVFVSSLATVYNVSDDDDSAQTVLSELKRKRDKGQFSLPTALSLLVFYVFACQCMSTLAVCRRETGSWWWTGFMFGYMTLLAYGAAFLTYRLAIWGGVG